MADDTYGSMGKEWGDLIAQAPPLKTPADWYQWGKGQPGFFGQYTDPATGTQQNTPPPAHLVGGGYGQKYNPKSGRWEITDTPTGGPLGWVEQNPYAFAALAAAAFAGGVALAPAAGAAGAGAAGSTAGGVTAGEAAGLSGEGALFGATPGTVSTGGGLSGAFSGASPYVTGGSYALKGAGALTGNEQLSQAGTALGLAGGAAGVGGSMAGEDWGSFGDYAKLAGTALSAGATAYGAISTARANGQVSDAASQQSELARQLLGEGAMARKLSSAHLDYFLSTGRIPYGLEAPPANTYGLDDFMRTGQLPQAVDLAPTTAANRDILEAQFARARENTINQTPQGGQMQAALTTLEGQRALGATQIYTDANEKRNKLAQSLYGTGLDFSREETQQDQDLRKQLFAAGLGLGTSTAGAAQQGLANASQGYGAVASNALKGTALAGDLAATLGAYTLKSNALQQQKKTNVQNDLNKAFTDPSIY